jgi:hypothetical protein
MHEHTLQAFADELTRIEKTAMSAKDIRALLLKGTKPLRRGVKQVKTVADRIDTAARNAAIHGYVKAPSLARKGLEVTEDLVNMGPPGPKGRHR